VLRADSSERGPSREDSPQPSRECPHNGRARALHRRRVAADIAREWPFDWVAQRQHLAFGHLFTSSTLSRRASARPADRESIDEVSLGRVLAQHFKIFGDGIDVLVNQPGDTGRVMRREARNKRLMLAERPRRMLRHAIEKHVTNPVEVHFHTGDKRPDSLTASKGKESGVHLLVESEELVRSSRIDRATLRREYFLELD